ncbi:surface carbohydrate biosynthesis protein [Magnetococcus sp. PR-3]|uniref:surface carbohydrate biosynthesis protein n=1 Tax=Magnetococcus sp. PR-3 TaxID=3120355 RepID=UPI002FCE442C
MTNKRVVLLVDDRKRDLNSLALIAQHLKKQGIDCYLQPLEAFRASLSAFKPHMIVFNHLVASHLADFSQRMSQMGVKVGVLPNEGLMYDKEEMAYNAGRFHSNAHMDIFFCWHKAFKQALEESGFGETTRLEVVGVPRFDLCFEPWVNIYETAPPPEGEQPLVLFCTRFVYAKYADMPPEAGDALFANWKDKISYYKDYWSIINGNHASRAKAMAYLKRLAESGKFRLILRPHPREDLQFYLDFLAALPADVAKRVSFDPDSPIAALIHRSDLVMTCEKCTTGLESWVVNRPTMTLVFDRHPMFYSDEHAQMDCICEDLDDVVAMTEAQMVDGAQANFEGERHAHLKEWCGNLDGDSTEKIADLIAQTLQGAPEPDWSQLTSRDRSRGWKLQLKNLFNHHYAHDYLLSIKRLFKRSAYHQRWLTHTKTIRPSDVKQAKQLLDEL